MNELLKYHSWLIKPKNFNDISELLWGGVIIDWQWAINTEVWKNYHE